MQTASEDAETGQEVRGRGLLLMMMCRSSPIVQQIGRPADAEEAHMGKMELISNAVVKMKNAVNCELICAEVWR